MKTQNSNVVSKANKSASKNSVKNSAPTRRVVETRDQWVVIFDYAVSLVVAYSQGNKPTGTKEELRKGFAFGATADCPHSRAYAKSLIWGFATSKAGKVLKDFDEVADKAHRVEIAKAILTDLALVKGDSKAIDASLNKVEPKRERVFAEAVLAELTKPTEKPTTKGGKKSAETKKPTTKGGKGGKKATK